MTNQDKKRWLQRYLEFDIEIGRMDKRIKVKLRRVDELRSLAERTTSVLTGMPHGGGYKSRDDIYVKLADLSREIDVDIDGYVDAMRKARIEQCKIEYAINSIADKTLIELLWLRYIEVVTFDQIAVKMPYCAMQVWRLHGKALEALDVVE